MDGYLLDIHTLQVSICNSVIFFIFFKIHRLNIQAMYWECASASLSSWFSRYYLQNNTNYNYNVCIIIVNSLSLCIEALISQWSVSFLCVRIICLNWNRFRRLVLWIPVVILNIFPICEYILRFWRMVLNYISKRGITVLNISWIFKIRPRQLSKQC